MKFDYTIIGGKGFIGSSVTSFLLAKGFNIFVPEKDDLSLFEQELGVVIYCAGYGDCQSNPYRVMDSNYQSMARILQKAKFDKFIYLSSTRLYMEGAESSEQDNLVITRNDNRSLFNISKIAAEEVCKLSGMDIIIARLSNVYGPAINSPLYLPSIVRDAIQKNVVNMYVSRDYAKDYVSVDDVALCLFKLSQADLTGFNLFNIASGVNVSANEIAEKLHNLTGCKIVWHEINSKEDYFPVTNISKLRTLVEFKPKDVITELSLMVSDFRKILN